MNTYISPKATLEDFTGISWLHFQVFIAESSFYDKLQLRKTLLYADTPLSVACPVAGRLTSISTQKRQNFSPRINNCITFRSWVRAQQPLISPARRPPLGFWRVCPQKVSKLKWLSSGQTDNSFDITHVSTAPEKSELFTQTLRWHRLITLKAADCLRLHAELCFSRRLAVEAKKKKEK